MQSRGVSIPYRHATNDGDYTNTEEYKGSFNPLQARYKPFPLYYTTTRDKSFNPLQARYKLSCYSRCRKTIRVFQSLIGTLQTVISASSKPFWAGFNPLQARYKRSCDQNSCDPRSGFNPLQARYKPRKASKKMGRQLGFNPLQARYKPVNTT